MTPLVPAEVDLRDFAFMPLDVVRLRDSDLAAIATGEGFRAAVLLWCASWHQAPAASLPKDDRLLARLAGYGRDLAAWQEVKDDALRGFVECSDGRLYHPVIAEKANEAWRSKLDRRARTSAATAARAKNEAAQRDVEPDVERGDNRDDPRNVHQGTGTGIGIGIDQARSLRSKAPRPDPIPRPATKDFDNPPERDGDLASPSPSARLNGFEARAGPTGGTHSSHPATSRARHPS